MANRESVRYMLNDDGVTDDTHGRHRVNKTVMEQACKTVIEVFMTDELVGKA
jgi:hypothetical protein